jgi:hypothetical protein
VNVRTITFFPLLLVTATGCLHEPALDFEGEVTQVAQPPAAPVFRRDISVAEAPSEPAPAVALAASPKDRPPPDPIPFRIGAGHGALGRVNLGACREQGLDPGYLRLRVTFQPSGRVAHASVESPAPPPQEALDCIGGQLQEAFVPAFDGRDATLSRSFFVAPGASEVEPDDVIVREHGSPPSPKSVGDLTTSAAPTGS